MLSRVKKNDDVIAEFLYDADGMRIKSEEKEAEFSDFKTTYYAYSYSGNVLMEESTGNSSDDSSETNYTSYIYAFAKTFAKVDGILDPTTITTTEIAYFHHDNQGSSRLMTDSSGKILMDQDYQPFGGDLARKDQVEVYNEIGVEYKYTGQKEVVSIGLYYYGARYYDPSIGRFITEDTYPGELANPQSQNLYLYVINNPLRYVDPTGHKYVEHDGGGYSWTPPESEPDREVINPNSGSSGSKPSINGMDLDLDTYTDLNGDYNVENKYGLNTGEDIKITIEQILNNTNIEAGYSYTKEITTGVIYDLTGLSRIRNVIGIKVNLNPTSEIQLSDKEISIKFEKSTIDISEDGITIDVDRQLKMGILKGFTTFEKKFLEEFENDNFRIGSVRQAILPLNETESPFYIPIYKQELPVSDAEGYVTLTYKHIYEWHQTTAAAAVVLGYKGVMAGGKAGFGLLGEWWKSRGPLWDTPVLE